MTLSLGIIDIGRFGTHLADRLPAELEALDRTALRRLLAE